jgi:hypothetical protein
MFPVYRLDAPLHARRHTSEARPSEAKPEDVDVRVE